MKKLKVLLGICVLILCLAACSNDTQNTPVFENEEALLAHLNGMWATENSGDTEYYIFQDGDVYNVSSKELTDSIEDLMDDTLNKQGIDGLFALDYQTVLTTLGDQGILGKKCRCQIDPVQGTITLNQGQVTEKSITVGNDTVYVEYKTIDWNENLSKISETVDLSGESFVKIFDDLKKNYTIPASKFWVTPKEYADAIKDSIITGGWWTLVSKDEESEVYSLDIPNRTGVFSASTESFLYSETFTYSTYFGTEKMSYLTMYDPYTDLDRSEFSMADSTSPDPRGMIQHAAFVVQNFPSAPDYEQLYSMLMNATGDVSGGTRTVEKSRAGITFKLSIATDGSWAQIFVNAPQTFKLSEIRKYYTPADRPSEDNHSGNGGSSSDGNSSSGGSSNSGNTSTGSSSGNNSSGNSGSSTQQPVSCEHNYAQATCTKPQTCTKCGQTTGAALGHTYSEATCTAPKTCTTCHETWGSAKGHSWREATCTAPKICQSCKTTEGSALPHSMYGTTCIKCGYADFSEYTLTSNTFCLDSWFKLDGARSQYLEDGQASINIDNKGVCKITFDQYSYTFTLKQTDFGSEPVFECYMNGEPVKTARVTFYYSQNRCDFFLYGGALGFSQVALNFDM